MKINDKIFSYPPYISTSWNNIAALHMKGTTLIVSMYDGESVQIPDMSPEILKLIFECHAAFMEEVEKLEMQKPMLGMELLSISPSQSEGIESEFPFRFGIGAIDAWGTAIQHNPAAAHSPNLPDEVLEKVRSISSIIAPNDPTLVPKPEPHCNCMHCQIARAINQGLGHSDIYNQSAEPEAISESDLCFQQWEIKEAEDKLFIVRNKLDADEKYSVFLGNPVGCTCGKIGCEHILAVLKS